MLRQASAATGSKLPHKQRSSSSGAAGLAKLQLAEGDVAKMVKEGVTCLAFCPGASRPLVAASDKSGQVGATAAAPIVESPLVDPAQL
jgi:hypothetical protein